MRRTSSWVAAAVAVGAAAWGAEPPTAVRLVPARAVESTSVEALTGQLFPSKMLPLGFEVGGRLAVSRVKTGDVVRAGQWLGSLDTEIVDAQVAQAAAGLAAAEAGASLATDVAGRNEQLKAEGSVSDVQSRSAVTQSKQAQAQVLVAKAALAQAKAARRRHDLRAPFAGTIIQAPDQVGGMVGPGMPVFILMQLDPLVMKTAIPEDLRGVVKPGLAVTVESVAAPVSTDRATVKVVIPSADPKTRRVPVEITVPNGDGRFVANSLARARMPVGAARKAFVIPSTALGTTGGEHVFVVKAGRLQRVPVTVLERTAREVTLVAPEPLTEIVDFPTSKLVEGAQVVTR